MIQSVEADGHSLRSEDRADKSAAYSRVTHPVRQSGLTCTGPRILQKARNSMQTCEQEVAEFEMQHAKKVHEVAKFMALKSITPETLFKKAGVFRGRPFNLYRSLRTAIINYLDDKVPTSIGSKVTQARRRARCRV